MKLFLIKILLFVIVYFIILYASIFEYYDVTFKDILNIPIFDIMNFIYITHQANTYVMLYMHLVLLIPLFQILFYLKQPKLKDEQGSAKFADLALIKKMELINKNDDKAIPLVNYVDSFGLKHTVSTVKPLSTLVLAPPGTGKTVFAMGVLFLTNVSFLVLDIKGEMYALTSAFRRYFFNNKIRIFNPMRKNTMKFNPLAKSLLEKMDFNEIAQEVKFISEILYQTDREDYFTSEGKSLFVGIALFLIFRDGYTSIPKVRNFLLQNFKAEIFKYYEYQKESFLEDNTTLNEHQFKYYTRQKQEVNRFKSDEMIDEVIKNLENEELGLSYYIENIILKDDNIERQIQDAFNALQSKGDNELGSIIGSTKTKLNAFDDNVVMENMEENEYDPLDFRTTKQTIYIVVSESEIKVVKPLINLFMEYTAKKMMSVTPDEKDETTIIIFDEFPRFGKLEEIVQIPALGRAYKMVLFLIAQDFAQIKSTYNQEMIEIILSTTAYKIIYPQMNKQTAQTISDMIGNETVVTSSYSSSQSGVSESFSLKGRPLVSTQDILSQNTGIVYLLVFMYYKNPIKAEPTKWYLDKKLKKKIKFLKDLEAKENKNNNIILNSSINTPDKKVNTPDKNINTPDKKVNTPDKNINTPDKKVNARVTEFPELLFGKKLNESGDFIEDKIKINSVNDL